MDDKDNPYEILGVPLEAEEKDIKKAYRKLAMKCHPDKQVTEEDKHKAHDKFSKIAEAYDTLTNPVKRYDWKLANERKMRSSSSSATQPPPPSARRRQGSATQTPKGKPRIAANRHSTSITRPNSVGDPLRNSYPGPIGATGANRPFRLRKKARDPFLIFEEVMHEEFGKDYRKKVASEWNLDDSSHSVKTNQPSRSLFGRKNSKSDKKGVPSYKDIFKDFDLKKDALLSKKD
jgi:curved DNA-binding protein CbpA